MPGEDDADGQVGCTARPVEKKRQKALADLRQGVVPAEAVVFEEEGHRKAAIELVREHREATPPVAEWKAHAPWRKAKEKMERQVEAFASMEEAIVQDSEESVLSDEEEDLRELSPNREACEKVVSRAKRV